MAVITLSTFTEEHVSEWLATRDINKAKPYVDLVRDLSIDGNMLSALVPGSAPEPYKVQAYLSQDQSGEMGVVSRCTTSSSGRPTSASSALKSARENIRRAPRNGGRSTVPCSHRHNSSAR